MDTTDKYIYTIRDDEKVVGYDADFEDVETSDIYDLYLEKVC